MVVDEIYEMVNMIMEYFIFTDRKISSIERVKNECFVADMDNSTDPIASVEGCCSSWVILNGSVVVAVLDVLQKI